MATRGRKLTPAAPKEIRDAAERQKREESTDGPTLDARLDWRLDNLQRAGRGMMNHADPVWLSVAFWLRKAVRASWSARMEPIEPGLLPGGELDHASRVALAFLKYHGGGPPGYGMSDACPEEFADPRRRFRRRQR